MKISEAGPHASVALTDRAPFSKEGDSGYHDVGALLAFIVPRALANYTTIALLKAVDAAADFDNGAVALVTGIATDGDVAPFYVRWNASSSATADDWTTFRPSAGAAATGNGRWIRQAYFQPARVANIAALQAATWKGAAAPLIVEIDANYYSGDGGGRFLLDASDTTTADDGAMCILTSTSGTALRYKRVHQGPWFDARWFGFRGNGGTDNATALARLLAWSQVGTYNSINVLFPRGTYMFATAIKLQPADGVSALRNIHLFGEGGDITDDGTVFQYNGTAHGAARLLIIRSLVQCTFTNIRFHTAVASLPRLVEIDTRGDQGTYLSTYNVSFYHCRFTMTNGALNDVMQIANSSNVTFEHCDWQSGTSEVAMRLGTRAQTVAITGIDIANDRFDVGTASVLRVGDRVIFKSLGGTTQLNDNVYYINAAIDTDTYTLCDEDGVAVDFSTFGSWTFGGTVQIASNDGSYGGGVASQISFDYCYWRGDIQHCRVDNWRHVQSTFSVTGSSERPTRITSVGDQWDKGGVLDQCFASFGSGALGAFYTQGPAATAYGLLVRGGRYGADHTVSFLLAGGKAKFEGVDFRSSVNGYIAIDAPADSVDVVVDPTCTIVSASGSNPKLTRDRRTVIQEWAAKSPLLNASFDFWQRGTSFGAIGGVPAVFTADRWKARRNVAASTWTVSREAGFLGSEYCARVQRNSGNTSTVAMYLGQQIRSANAKHLAGHRVSLIADIRCGANYSMASSLLNLLIHCGTGFDEVVALATGFATGNTTLTPSAQAISTTAARVFFPSVLIPADATEIAVVFGFTPVGMAGAADYFEVTNVRFGGGRGDGIIADMFRPRTYENDLAECLSYYEAKTVRSENGSRHIPLVRKRATPTVSVGVGSAGNITADGFELTHTTAADCTVTAAAEIE